MKTARCAHIGCTEERGRDGVCREHRKALVARPRIDQPWYYAEVQVRMWLHKNGVDSEKQKHQCPFDLLTSNGIRIEVKYSPMHVARDGSMSWNFNIHRRNRMNEGHVDFYVLRCEGIKSLGLGASFNLVVPSPINALTVNISPRNLISRWAKYFNAVHLIVAFKGRNLEKVSA